ncbi:MAG: ABC transporter permease subunit [Chloroflexi bacterium]|nr:ABC transporter permease subunit [Chloroflexota bacterium]
MRRSLFLAHLKMGRWGVVAWAGSFFVFGLFVMYMHPFMAGAEGMSSYVENLPEAIKIAGGFGGVSLSGGLLSLEIWVVTEFLGWWPLIVGVYAIFAAGGIAAREVERGTMDLVLAQPVRRYQVLASKFAVFLAGLIGIALASLIGLILGLALIETDASLKAISLGLAPGLLLVLAIGSYSVLFSCVFLDSRKTLTASGSLTAALYILNFMAPSLGKLEPVNRLSLFYYYRPYQVVHTSTLDWTGAGIFLAVAVVCFVAAVVVFQRRDITA